MFKLRVNPLVLAASLGLLGPAALADDEDREDAAGLWRRDADLSEAPAAAARLGEQIEVIRVDDRVLLDDGLGTGAASKGTWTRMDGPDLSQELVVADARVRRDFHVEDGALEVVTRVEHDGATAEFRDRYTRLA